MTLSLEQAAAHVLERAKAKKLDQVDALLEKGRSLSVKVFRGKLEKIDQSAQVGLGVRVVDQGRTGLAYTERLTPQALELALEEAAANAQLSGATGVFLPPPPGPLADPAGLGLYNPALDEVGVEEMAAFALAMEQSAREASPQVAEVTQLVVSRSSGGWRLVSSLGQDYGQESSRTGAWCSALLRQGEKRKSGQYGWSARQWEPAMAPKIGRLAAQAGAGLLAAGPPPAQGPLPVVLDEFTAPGLLAQFLGAFSGEAVQQNRSRLKGLLGQQVAVPGFSLSDQPHRPGLPGSSYLDGEGVATQPLPLIQDGRLENFLYHIESAQKEGRSSTGHAARSLSSGVSTTAHNLVVPLGGHTVEALCALPPRCLLVTELEGGAGCSALSGDISIGVQGYYYEQGRRLQPVEGVTLAGNFFDLLKNIQALGNFYQPNLTSRLIPPLLVEGLTLSG